MTHCSEPVSSIVRYYPAPPSRHSCSFVLGAELLTWAKNKSIPILIPVKIGVHADIDEAVLENVDRVLCARYYVQAFGLWGHFPAFSSRGGQLHRTRGHGKRIWRCNTGMQRLKCLPVHSILCLFFGSPVFVVSKETRIPLTPVAINRY